MAGNRKPKHVKGQGTIFKDDRSPYWQLSYWNGWRQVRESSKTRNKEEAARILTQRVADLVAGRGGPEHIRVKTLFALLLDNYRRLDRSSLYQTELRLKRYLNDFFGELKSKEVTSKWIREYIDFRKGAAASTINQELAIIRRAFALRADEEPPLVTRRLRSISK